MSKIPSQDEVLQLLRAVFAEGLPEREVPGDRDPLFGPAAQLDSMELVAFVADVEEAVEERWGEPVILADERALSRSRSPFRHLLALAGYVVELLTGEAPAGAEPPPVGAEPAAAGAGAGAPAAATAAPGAGAGAQPAASEAADG